MIWSASRSLERHRERQLQIRRVLAQADDEARVDRTSACECVGEVDGESSGVDVRTGDHVSVNARSRRELLLKPKAERSIQVDGKRSTDLQPERIAWIDLPVTFTGRQVVGVRHCPKENQWIVGGHRGHGRRQCIKSRSEWNAIVRQSKWIAARRRFPPDCAE